MSSAAPAAAVAVVLLGGALLWRELDRTSEQIRADRAGHATNPTGATTGAGSVGALPGLLPPGTAQPVTDMASLLAEQRRLDLEREKAQTITQLRRELDGIWNSMDLQILSANTIKNTPPDPAWVKAVTDAEWAAARNEAFGWVRWNDGNMAPRIAEAIKTKWAAELARRLVPVQAELSRLNALQLRIIDNLRQLGYSVPVASVKQGTVTT